VTRALENVAEDRERRERRISLKRWLAAPAPPTTREGCENAPRPCPHLRCIYHLGEAGDGSQTCVLDVAELPQEERTQKRVAEILGVAQPRIAEIERIARDKTKARKPHDTLIALGVRRRSP